MNDPSPCLSRAAEQRCAAIGAARRCLRDMRVTLEALQGGIAAYADGPVCVENTACALSDALVAIAQDDSAHHRALCDLSDWDRAQDALRPWSIADARRDQRRDVRA